MSDEARDEPFPKKCLATEGMSKDSGKDDKESTDVLPKISGLEVGSSDREDHQHNNHLSATICSDTDKSFSNVKLINAEKKVLNFAEKQQHSNHPSVTSLSDTDKSFSNVKLINVEKKVINYPEKHNSTAGNLSKDNVKIPINAKIDNNTENTKYISKGRLDNQENEILSKVVPYGIDTLATSEEIPDHAAYDLHTISHGVDTPLFEDDRYPGKAKTDEKAKDDEKATIDRHLKIACRHGSFHLLKKLLNEHYLTLMPDEEGRTPLFEACLAGRHDVVKFLVDYGFDVNHQDHKGKTPLHVSAEHQLWSVYDLLLDEYKANFKLRDSRNWTPIHYAIDTRNKKYPAARLINEFFEQDLGTDVSWLQLHAACLTGQLQTVKLLIQHKVDINRVSSRGKTALLMACFNNNCDIVDCLIQHGADVNKVYMEGHIKFTTLIIAIVEGYTSIAMRLIENGADVMISDNESTTPLHHAAFHNQLDVMRKLLNNGANINCTNLASQTPLHHAAANEMDEALKLLLEYEPELHHHDAKGNTALHNAVGKIRTNNAILLLQHGADPLIRNTQRDCTPFDMAMAKREEHPELLKALIQVRPSIIDTVKMTKLTALHLFCWEGKADMVKYLLDNGANKDLICDGKLPIDFALNKEHMNIVEMLVDAGANVTLDASEMAFTFLEKIYIKRHAYMSLLQRVFASKKCLMDLTHKNNDGETFLYQVCRDGEYKVIRMMLESKRAEIGLNICNNEGKSPLAILCEQASKLRMDAVFSVSMIVECRGNNLDVDTVDSEMKTPLHRACEADCIFIVNILLNESLVSLNARDAMGKTPIQYVSATGNQDIVELLLKFGAETD